MVESFSTSCNNSSSWGHSSFQNRPECKVRFETMHRVLTGRASIFEIVFELHSFGSKIVLFTNSRAYCHYHFNGSIHIPFRGIWNGFCNSKLIAFNKLQMLAPKFNLISPENGYALGILLPFILFLCLNVEYTFENSESKY